MSAFRTIISQIYSHDITINHPIYHYYPMLFPCPQFSRYPIVLLSHDPMIFPLNIGHASHIPLLKIEEMPAHEYPHERYPINLHDTTKIASSDTPILFPSYSLIILLTSMNPLWIPSLYSRYLSQYIPTKYPTKYPTNYISEIFPWYSQVCVYIYIHISLLSHIIHICIL